MTPPPEEAIVQCPSCEGYGWFEDEFSGETVDCDWCAGTGYVYRNADGVDRAIPPEDYGRVARALEDLEAQRLRGLGYTGSAVHPDEQAIRRRPPDPAADDDDPAHRPGAP